MKKKILIYDGERGVLKFLRSFFRKHGEYSAHFIKRDKAVLLRELERRRPDALIMDAPGCLEDIKPSKLGCPVIATIPPGNVASGIRAALRSGVEYYLLSPFYKEDLEQRIKVAIGKKSWLEDLYRERKDLETLIELIYLVSSTLKPKEVLYLIVQKISDILNVTRCSMINLDTEDPRYAYVVSTFEDPKITNMRIDLRKYPEIRRALFLKSPVVIKDAMKDPVMKEVKDVIAPLNIRSIMVVPVVFHDEVIGTLLLRTARMGRTFTKREIRLCTAIANASANILYNAFLYDRLDAEKSVLERLSVTDYLTGVYNARYFYNRLEEEFSRSERYKMPLSCMMLDIDRFKRVNDTYGHRIGDIVLREFAQLLKDHTRKSDVFARYGGEEFIILLPQASLKGAIAEAERLGRIVREYRFKALKEGDRITMSIGIACTEDATIKASDDLITCADNALFVAKRGRNQIVAHPAL